jgi:hypothetical protein
LLRKGRIFVYAAKVFPPREIAPEKQDFNAWLIADKEHKLSPLFDPSEKYRLIETYGFDCYKETASGLRFEIGFTKRDYILVWRLASVTR